jgi:hypothetical protein
MQSRFTIAALPRTLSLATALAAALICTTPPALANIDTSAAASTPFGFFGSGPSNISSFGQTISTGATDSQLNSFSFWTSALDLDVMAFVTVWHAENPAVQYMDENWIFASDIFNIGDSFSGYRPVTVQTPGVTLAANQHYVLMLTSSGLSDDPGNHNSWLKTNTDAYSGGSFVYTSVQENFDQMFSTNPAGWDCGEGRCAANANGQDLVFSADISAIPEPATSGLLFAGLAGLAGLGRLRNPSRRSPTVKVAQAPR